MKHLIAALTFAAISLPSNAAMTATYLGNPFVDGMTSWGALSATFTFSDDFQPVSGQWATESDITFYSVSLTNGPSFVSDRLYAGFLFNDAGKIQDWWFIAGEKTSVGSWPQFTSYHNGYDGPGEWDSASYGLGSTAWTYSYVPGRGYVFTPSGEWTQSALLIPIVPEPSDYSMLLAGLAVMSWALIARRANPEVRGDK